MTVVEPSLDQCDLFDIGRHGDAPAMVLDDRVLSHADLDRLVEDRLALLGSTRRLVLVECANALDPLVTYLAALRGRHPVLLVPAPSDTAQRRQWDDLSSAYDPDVTLVRSGSEWNLIEHRAGSRHELHPDLALLLGTSGSTGTPKLVRLSHDNLRSNAAAIAAFLDLGPRSRAATTLPLHYCYGLSVVNSHLLAGGSLWLTDRSVVDDGFWEVFTDTGATSFAGVPYTFELLERSGVDWAAQPGLTQVTQAGGALSPDRVREFALRGRRHGFDFVVMYGQTEATARMAYLPPELAADHPHAIGVPIEGGDFRLDQGELVYTGPNVMLGYAECAGDLAAGRTVTELRTGDLAIRGDDGLYRLVGRRSRLAKLYGTRLDLDLAERMLREKGIDARLVSDDTVLRVFLDQPAQVDTAVRAVTTAHCVPAHAVRAHVVATFPTTASGKPDYGALQTAGLAADSARSEGSAVDVRSAYEVVLGRRVRGSDTFAGLGGDSLSYVEMVVRLERVLGTLPADWPRLTVDELAARRPRRRRLLARVDTPLLLRAVAITLIVGSHVELWSVLGGAHALLVLFGYNLARFALQAPTGRQRIRALGRSLRELVLPATVWISAVALTTDLYRWPTALFLNGLLGRSSWTVQWQFWFLETAVWTTVALAILVLVPRVGSALGRWPMGVPLAVLAASLVLRWGVRDDGHVVATYSIAATAWCVVLGWAAASARGTTRRLLVSALVPVCTYGFFGEDHLREAVVVLSALLLVWLPQILLVRPLDRAVTWLGGASLFVYLTHWVVYPHLEQDHRVLAWLASMTAGVVAWRGYVALRRHARPARRAAYCSTIPCSRTGSASMP